MTAPPQVVPLAQKRICFTRYDYRDSVCHQCFDRDECKVKSEVPKPQRWARSIYDEIWVVMLPSGRVGRE